MLANSGDLNQTPRSGFALFAYVPKKDANAYIDNICLANEEK